MAAYLERIRVGNGNDVAASVFTETECVEIFVKNQTVGLILLLAFFWLVNSGHYTPLLLGLGLASIALAVIIAKRMEVIDEESIPLDLSPKLLTYHLWLLKELVISNLQVVRRIWLASAKLNPAMETIDITQDSDIGRVILANSITLTPGTITTAVSADSITVHVLDRSSLEALRRGDMDVRVRRLTR